MLEWPTSPVSILGSVPAALRALRTPSPKAARASAHAAIVLAHDLHGTADSR
jgi:hypothetical protein